GHSGRQGEAAGDARLREAGRERLRDVPDGLLVPPRRGRGATVDERQGRQDRKGKPLQIHLTIPFLEMATRSRKSCTRHYALPPMQRERSLSTAPPLVRTALADRC